MKTTIYQEAQTVMRDEIKLYLALAESTHGFTRIEEKHFDNLHTRLMFGAGIGLHIQDPINIEPSRLVHEWMRKSAVAFDIERGVTVGVYHQIRSFAEELFNHAAQVTNDFTVFNADTVYENPQFLPIFQHLAGIFSKAALKKEVGSVSDTGFSRPAAQRLSTLLSERVNHSSISKANVLQRMESTLEGIVRDLVGRVLLEEIVAEALKEESVPYLRESEYTSLAGVVYDFRADFVIPDEKTPIAFIEVRKSSSRHASLYAKDKMFSAINWKGHHRELIGIIIVDGDWTQATLQTLAKVYDYVIPLHQCPFMAKIVKRAAGGDKSILKWLLEFSIMENPRFCKLPMHTE